MVDDDPIFRMIFRLTLKKCYPKIDLIEFSDGMQACNAFSDGLNQQRPMPRGIFMDINMPVMNGWGCMDKIQELIAGINNRKPLLYVVSSSINPEDEMRANAYDVTSGYLVKPITIDVLKEIFG